MSDSDSINQSLNKDEGDNLSQQQSEPTNGVDVEALKKEVEKYRNDYLYLRAEFDNYKRNAIKERSELVKYGSERAAIEVLNVIDNFERALSVQVSPDTINNFIKGIEMTANDLKQAMGRLGIQEVNCQGVPFDPFIHEALSSEETTEVPEGHVFRVFKKAYKLHDKVIRPAQVVVAKKPTAN